MAIQQNADPTESTLDPDAGTMAEPVSPGSEPDEDESEELFDDAELLAFLGDAKRRSRTYQQNVVLAMWERSEAAYRSEHGSSSKYGKEQYKNRAKYFKPKTRVAVKKNLTATANALFASQDVIQTEAHNDADQTSVANAALLKELINARLNNKTIKSGLPWLQTVLGARHSSQVSGVVCSKQEWTYRCIERPVVNQEERPVEDGMGGYLIDPETNEPFMQIVEFDDVKKDVVIDKPMVTIIPSESVLIDPETDWINPAQASPTLIVQWPMHVDSVRSMMDDEKSTTPWRKVDDTALQGALYQESELMGLKTAREGNAASTQLSKARMGGMGHEVVEVRENFFRKDGRDYHCWTLKDQFLLSDPVPTEEAYPAHRGGRPYVIGTDSIEPFVLYPQSPVDSWRQSQDEINDFTNIRMDGARQSVYPVAKVKAGRGIDYKAVQRRDQQGIILVREQEDVVFDRPTANISGVDREVQLLSNDFDEQAGIFSQNSVQSNRQIGDTVGGMQLVAASANATSELDLRVFIETWLEPVLSQIVSLEQYYEDDETLLAVAGNRAQLFQKFGIDEITDELLESQIQLSVSGGLGAADPMQKLIKFKGTFDIAGPVLMQAVQAGKAEINYEEVLNEIFSLAGHKNGAARFVTMKQEGEQPAIPPEKVQELMQMMQALKAENEKLKGDQTAKLRADLAKTQMVQEGETQRTVMQTQADMALQDDAQRHELLMRGVQSLETMATMFP